MDIAFDKHLWVDTFSECLKKDKSVDEAIETSNKALAAFRLQFPQPDLPPWDTKNGEVVLV